MTERVRLTDSVVESASCPAGRKDVLVFDADLRGFAVRVTARGGKTFLLQYRLAGVVRRAVIGAWGEVTTAQARKKAEALRGTVREHRDPFAERRQRLAEQRDAEARAKAEAAAAAAAGAFTVDRLISQWADLRLVERSASYRTRVPREMRRALAKWCDAPAASLDHAAAVQILDDVKGKRGPVAANRLRAVASACWSWATKRGSITENPWRNTERPAVEAARERVLSDSEIAALWAAAQGLEAPWSGLVRALLLTGQRRGEVAGMAWPEIDEATNTWNLAATRVKNRKAHRVPLSKPMLALLAEQPRRKAGQKGSHLVFRGARGTAPSGFGRVKARLDAAMRKAAKEAGRTVKPWTLHDLRRSVATGLQRLGVRLEVTEAILNHVSGSRAGIVGVYQRHGWETEKAAALEAWGTHVLALAEAGAGSTSLVPAEELAQRRAKRRRPA